MQLQKKWGRYPTRSQPIWHMALSSLGQWESGSLAGSAKVQMQEALEANWPIRNCYGNCLNSGNTAKNSCDNTELSSREYLTIQKVY